MEDDMGEGGVHQKMMDDDDIGGWWDWGLGYTIFVICFLGTNVKIKPSFLPER